MRPYVRAAALGNYADVARQAGLDAQAMLRAAKLDAAVLEDPDRHIPSATVARLLEDSARQSGCDTFGLRMAESWRLSDFGAVSLLLTHERTLRDALEAVTRFRHLINDTVTISVEDAPPLVVIREELVGAKASRSRQAIELALGVMFRLCRALLGAQWKPKSVCFTHAAPASLSVHHRIFGSVVEFGKGFNGIVCAAVDFDRPNPASDPALASHARRYVDSLPGRGRKGVSQEVRRAIYILLPSGDSSMARIADELGTTTRTLQRQLERAGESYAGLLNEARRHLVPRYLENPAYSLMQVSELLGYGFQSSFTRWFRGEFGMSPARWRAAKARKGAKG